jgi:hypothetical protein
MSTRFKKTAFAAISGLAVVIGRVGSASAFGRGGAVVTLAAVSAAGTASVGIAAGSAAMHSLAAALPAVVSREALHPQADRLAALPTAGHCTPASSTIIEDFAAAPSLAA